MSSSHGEGQEQEERHDAHSSHMAQEEGLRRWQEEGQLPGDRHQWVQANCGNADEQERRAEKASVRSGQIELR
jgi:hypothetical protein